MPQTTLLGKSDVVVLACGATAAARSPCARPRPDGHPLRDGIPPAAEPATRGDGNLRRRIHLRRRQARRDHRRRRHGCRLSGDGSPPGRRQRHAARAAVPAADDRGQETPGPVAQHLPRVVRARRGRRPFVLDCNGALQWRRHRSRHHAAHGEGPERDRQRTSDLCACRRHGADDSRRSRIARNGLRRSGTLRRCSTASAYG